MIVLLLHCEGGDGTTDFVDSSHPPITVETQGGARISTANSKFGIGCGIFEGGGENNVLRLHFDDASGSQDFTDSSPLAHILSPNGNPVISDAQVLWGNSGLFDGGSSLTNQSLDFVITRDTSFDIFLNFSDTSTRQTILGIDKDVPDDQGLELYFDPDTIILNFGGTIISADWTPVIGTWYMLSMARVGAYIYLYINGSEVAKGFRRTGLVIADSTLSLSNPNIPIPSNIFFSKYVPGAITAIEYVADIPVSSHVIAQAKQNIKITSSDLETAPSLREISEDLIGLTGRIYFGMALSSSDGKQIVIDDISLHYEDVESYDGTLSKVQINKYEGAENSDTLLRIPTSHLALDNLTNILFRIDQNPSPYMIMWSDATETELIITSINKRDNLTTHLNVGTDIHWNSVGMNGSGIDWNGANGGVYQIGYWSLSDGYWTTDQYGELRTIEDAENFSILTYLKKEGDKSFSLVFKIDDLEWEISFDDEVPFMLIDGEEFPKDFFPWEDRVHSFNVKRHNDNLIFKVDNQVVTTRQFNFDETVSTRMVVDDFDNTSVRVRSYYTGPLVYGNAKTGTRSDLNYTYLTNDKSLAEGYMLYAGIPDLDSVGLMYITEYDVYIDQDKLDIPLPPDLVDGSKILGFKDMKTSETILFYSNSEKTYYYKTEWILLGEFQMIDLYKDQWSEGIVYTEAGSAYWVQLFERDEDGSLTLSGEKSIFSITPTDTEYKFEAPMDYRKRKGTIPWLWIRSKENE